MIVIHSYGDENDDGSLSINYIIDAWLGCEHDDDDTDRRGDEEHDGADWRMRRVKKDVMMSAH